MSEVSNKLRLMVAAPNMVTALVAFLPKGRDHFEELSAIATSTNNGWASHEAGEWLEIIMLAECALKEAGVSIPVKPTPEPGIAYPRLLLVPRAKAERRAIMAELSEAQSMISRLQDERDSLRKALRAHRDHLDDCPECEKLILAEPQS